MVDTAQDVWDQTRTKLGSRQGSLNWVKPETEVAELIDKIQIAMAYQIPDTLAYLVGELRETYQISASLTATGYSNAKKFTLPDDTIRIFFIEIDFGSGYKQCDLKQSDDKRKLDESNHYDDPTEDYPWAFIIGQEVWVAPLTSVTTKPVMIDRSKRPDAIESLNDPLQVSSVLREIIPSYVAAQLAKKKRLWDIYKTEYGEFKTDWLEITGVEWKEPREGHTPPEDQKTEEERT